MKAERAKSNGWCNRFVTVVGIDSPGRRWDHGHGCGWAQGQLAISVDNRSAHIMGRISICLRASDIKGKAFQINKYYKVQIRFTSIEATTPNYDGVQDIDNWLAGNQNCFSEWSTVCLVRGISTPRLQISGLDSSAGTTMWTTADTQMIGSVTFANEAETDILKSYQLRLYNNDTGELITDSGLQYANAYNNVNQINYVLKCEFIDDINYRLEVIYTTSLLYESSVEYEFTVSQTSLDILEATIDTIIDAENGRIGILLQSLNEESVFMGRLTIRRTSSESNYTVWEDVYTTAITDNKALNLVWYDYSVKSGVWYKYCAQRRNSIGARGVAIALENPVMVNYEYCFLVGDNKQLKMKYNTNISSVKRNIAESKIDTIGSKYPFIRRNGDMNYTTFSITGLITRFMDEEEIFTSKEEILNNQNELYDLFVRLQFKNFIEKLGLQKDGETESSNKLDVPELIIKDFKEIDFRDVKEISYYYKEKYIVAYEKIMRFFN